MSIDNATLQEYLDKAIKEWRAVKVDAEVSPDRFIDAEKQKLVASCYVDAFQSVRVSMLGELLP